MNDDTEQEIDWIDKLVDVAESDDKIAALQPKVLSLRDKKMFEYAGAGGGYIDIYGYPLCRGRVFFDMEEDKKQYDDLKNVFWSCGVAMLIRREVLDEIGYMDEDFFLYSEEMDLGWRMNLAGYKQYIVPKSVIYHLGSATTGTDSRKFEKEYLLHRNVFVTLLKNYSRKTWFRIVPIKFGLEMIALFAFLFKEPKKSLAIGAANLWILLNIGKIIKKNKRISKLRKVSDKDIMNMMVKRSIVWKYFLSGKKNFESYKKDIPNYNNFY